MQLHEQVEAFAEREAELVLVGNGEAHFISGFRETTRFDGKIYTDPSREVFNALGFSNNKRATFSPKVLLSGVKAFVKGHRQRGVQGDPWQQGGLLIVSKEQKINFYHAFKTAGEALPWEEIWHVLVRSQSSSAPFCST